MRQRKVKNEEQRIEALGHLLIRDSTKLKGEWDNFLRQKGLSEGGRTFLEIGCGRGDFIGELAESKPSDFFLGAEGRSSVILRAMELIDSGRLGNVLFIPEFINRVEDYFDKGEISGIYLNFSDPWPKLRHGKRRLTHRDYLKGYRSALKDGGFIEFKTDSETFFNFTLSECAALEMKVLECTNDLHKSDYKAKNRTTQYENRFILLGKPIHYCRILI